MRSASRRPTPRLGLRAVVFVALAHPDGIAGGIWQTGSGPLAYAFPTSPGTGAQSDPESGVPIVRRDPAATSQQAFERARVDAGSDPLAPGPHAASHLEAARLVTYRSAWLSDTEGPTAETTASDAPARAIPDPSNSGCRPGSARSWKLY